MADPLVYLTVKKSPSSGNPVGLEAKGSVFLDPKLGLVFTDRDDNSRYFRLFVKGGQLNIEEIRI